MRFNASDTAQARRPSAWHYIERLLIVGMGYAGAAAAAASAAAAHTGLSTDAVAAVFGGVGGALSGAATALLFRPPATELAESRPLAGFAMARYVSLARAYVGAEAAGPLVASLAGDVMASEREPTGYERVETATGRRRSGLGGSGASKDPGSLLRAGGDADRGLPTGLTLAGSLFAIALVAAVVSATTTFFYPPAPQSPREFAAASAPAASPPGATAPRYLPPPPAPAKPPPSPIARAVPPANAGEAPAPVVPRRRRIPAFVPGPSSPSPPTPTEAGMAASAAPAPAEISPPPAATTSAPAIAAAPPPQALPGEAATTPVPAEKTTAAEEQPGPAPPPAAAVAAVPSKAPAKPSPALATLEPRASAPQTATEDVTGLIDRGNRFLAEGDVVSARRFFERAAEAGSPAAACGLAKSFDPSFLRRSGAVGVAADPQKAALWQQKCRPAQTLTGELPR